MKTYYQQLKPIVLSYLKHYQTDFTTHDRKNLLGYTGEFYYAIRTSGTDLFRTDLLVKAINSLISEQKTDYFTSKGLNELRDGKFSMNNSFSVYAILARQTNERFFIGQNGKVKEFPFPKFETLMRKRIAEIDKLALELKGSWFVAQLADEVFLQEKKRRLENYQPTAWQFSQAQPS